MSKNYCNCPNCQTENCPAGADWARALADIEMLRKRPIVEGGQAGYDQLRAELEAAKTEKDDVVRGAGFVMEQYQATKKAVALQGEEIDRLRSELESAKAKLQRMTDLVRYQRAELYQSGLLTDEEYADLAKIGGSPARLETYDDLRDHIAKCQKDIVALMQERDNCKSLWQQAIKQVDEAEAENARLAAALQLGKELLGAFLSDGVSLSQQRQAIAFTKSDNSTALRDLLGPTVELTTRAIAVLGPASRLYKNAALSALKVDCEREDTRLRALRAVIRFEKGR